MDKNKFERFEKAKKKPESNFYVKVCSTPVVRTSQGLLIELDDDKGIVNIGEGNEEVKDYTSKKEALIKLVTKTHASKLAEMEKQLNETIAKHGNHKGVEKYIHVRFDGKEYKLNFGTNVSEKQGKYYVSFVNAIFKITD